jgi:carboxyl-terminal processing protease
MRIDRNRIRWTFALLVFAGGIFASSVSFGDPMKPSAQERQIALVVSKLIGQQHLLRHPLDDEISQRGFERFFNSLDPAKNYFTQADITEFKVKEKELDNMLEKRDLGFPFVVFERFLKRVDERTQLAETLLKGKFDFTLEEFIETDSDARTYAATEAEAQDRWRKRVKLDLLHLKDEKVDSDEATSRLQRRYSNFRKRMVRFTAERVLEIYLTAITTSFDPHSTYMAPSTIENFMIAMRLNFEGIGAELQDKDGLATIVRVMPGGAAERQGQLKSNDRIVSVGQGAEGEMSDVTDLSLDEIVQQIRGERGTIVRVGVVTAAGKKDIYNITRDKIILSDGKAKAEIVEKGEGTKKLKIGTIDLPSFYFDMKNAAGGVSCTKDVKEILIDFKTKNVDAVVLDLRRNGGGSLREAIDLTGLFLHKGCVVQITDPLGNIQKFDDPDANIVWDGPLVVLTSRLSASASEILAGAIQDYGRGIVVGDKSTHGKGTVQSVVDLGPRIFGPNSPNLGSLKITTQQFYRPSGDSTQRRGVVPDIKLPSVTNHLDIGEATLDHAVKFNKIAAATFTKYKMNGNDVVKRLTDNSSVRQKTSEDFGKLSEIIAKVKEVQSQTKVSLNEAEFMKRRQEQSSGDDSVEPDEKDEDKRSFYYEEVLNITHDYAKLLQRT